MRTIHLYGQLAKKFGRKYVMDVRSLSETALALGCQLPGFREMIEAGHFRVTCGPSRSKGMKLDESLITFGLPKGDLHIVPAVQGSGGGKGGKGTGLGKLIAGVLIAAATWWMGGPAWLISLGASTALAGVASLLSPKKKAEVERKSYMFDTADNTIKQGDSVPLIIGTCMASGLPISSGVTVSDSNGLW